MAVRIARELIDRLIAEAAAHPDEEVCGLLFGSADRIDAAVATANVAPDPTRWFEIDPAALIAAHKAERAGWRRLIGCYHSHPSGDARPSVRDREAAEAGRLWLIIGNGQVCLWRATCEGFKPIEIATSEPV
jgi:desampylase